MREALNAAYEACRPACEASGLSRERFIEFYSSWRVTPLYVHGEVVGAVLQEGPEMHVAVLPKAHRRWARPSIWRQLIDGTIDRYGYAITSVAEANTDGQAFVSRLGFRETGRNGSFIFYRLERQ